MTVNEAIAELEKMRDRGFGEMKIQSDLKEINGADVVLSLEGFYKSSLGIIMELEEDCIY